MLSTMYSGIHASAGLLVVRVTLGSIFLPGGHEMSLSPTRKRERLHNTDGRRVASGKNAPLSWVQNLDSVMFWHESLLNSENHN